MKNDPIVIPKWPFYVADVMLLALAYFIYYLNAGLLDGWTALATLLCVFTGAGFFVVPYLLEFRAFLNIETAKLQQKKEIEEHKLQHLVEEALQLNQETLQFVERTDRDLTIFESLLRRMESRLHNEQANVVGFDGEENQENDEDLELEDEDDDEEIDFEFEPEDFEDDEEAEPEVPADELPLKYEKSEKKSPKKDQKKDAPQEQPPGERITIIAFSMMGLGSKPFIRGKGGGLDENKGLPMEFLESGKWRWVSERTTEPLTINILKNDETPMKGGPKTYNPGAVEEISPEF